MLASLAVVPKRVPKRLDHLPPSHQMEEPTSTTSTHDPPTSAPLQQPVWYSDSSSEEDHLSSRSSGSFSDDTGDLFDSSPAPYFPTASGPSFAPKSPAPPSPHQPSMTIRVKIEGWSQKIACGAGNQSIKWLCLTAVERYRLERTPMGRVRARESNRPLRRRRPDEDSEYNPLRGIRGCHVPSDIKLKKSLKKVVHRLNEINWTTKLKMKKTADFFQNANNVNAQKVREASLHAAAARVGVTNKNLQADSAKSDLGLDQCHLLKKRGRGGDGNRIPNCHDPLRLHLQDGDSMTIILDETGGSYVKRNGAFSVSAYMRLRYMQRRKHKGIEESDSSNDSESDEDDDWNIVYVRKRGVEDRNTTKQLEENLSRLALFKFVKDQKEHESLRQIFTDHDVYDHLRRLFRHYAYGGAGDAFSMDVGEWESCCKDAGVLDHPGMTYGKVDTVFIAANYTAKAASKEAKKKAVAAGKKMSNAQLVGNPDNAFTLHEFIEGICRLGIAMWPDGNKEGLVTYTDRVGTLLEQYMYPLAESVSADWDIFQDIEDKLVQRVYHDRMQELEEKFRQFCHHNQKKKDIRKLHMFIDGYIDFVESSGLLREDDVLVTASTTHRVIRECFIWSQRKTTHDKTSVVAEEQSLNKMDFNEFLESLALLAHRTFAEQEEFAHASGSHAEHLREQLLALLDVLLVTRREGALKK